MKLIAVLFTIVFIMGCGTVKTDVGFDGDGSLKACFQVNVSDTVNGMTNIIKRSDKSNDAGNDVDNSGF